MRGIASLVTSSVEGLKTENVSITDSTGHAALAQAARRGGGAARHQAAGRAALPQATEAKLNAMLIADARPRQGPGRRSTPTSTPTRRRSDKLKYDKKGTPVKHATETESSRAPAVRGGAAGTAATSPVRAGQRRRGGDSNYNHELEDDRAGVGKTVERTKVAPGEVERQNVAVVVDKSVPPADVAELAQTRVAAAAGIDEERGDTITVSQVAFAKPEAPEKPSPAGGALGIAKWVALGLAMLLFLFFVTRHLRSARASQLEPVWLREIETPTTLAELEGDTLSRARPAASRRAPGATRRSGGRSSSSTPSASLSRCAPG